MAGNVEGIRKGQCMTLFGLPVFWLSSTCAVSVSSLESLGCIFPPNKGFGSAGASWGSGEAALYCHEGWEVDDDSADGSFEKVVPWQWVKIQHGNPIWQWKISSRWFCDYRHGFRRCTGTNQPVGQKCTKWMVLIFEGWNRRPSEGHQAIHFIHFLLTSLCWAAQQETPAVSQGLPCFSSGLRTAWGGESLWVPERCGDLSWVWHKVFVARASPEKIIYSPYMSIHNLDWFSEICFL